MPAVDPVIDPANIVHRGGPQQFFPSNRVLPSKCASKFRGPDEHPRGVGRAVDASWVESEPVLVWLIGDQISTHAGSAAKRSIIVQMCLMPRMKSST